MSLQVTISEVKKELEETLQKIKALKFKAKTLGESLSELKKIQAKIQEAQVFVPPVRQRPGGPRQQDLPMEEEATCQEPAQELKRSRRHTGYKYRGSTKNKNTLADLAAAAIKAYGPMVIEDVELAIREMNPGVEWAENSIRSCMSPRRDLFHYNAISKVWSLIEEEKNC